MAITQMLKFIAEEHPWGESDWIICIAWGAGETAAPALLRNYQVWRLQNIIKDRVCFQLDGPVRRGPCRNTYASRHLSGTNTITSVLRLGILCLQFVIDTLAFQDLPLIADFTMGSPFNKRCLHRMANSDGLPADLA
jgi:hypothetical protein